MKKLSTTTIYSIIVMVIFLAMPVLLHAQPEDPGGEPTPIDGGLSLLIAAGVGYGAKKVRDNRKKK